MILKLAVAGDFNAIAYIKKVEEWEKRHIIAFEKKEDKIKKIKYTFNKAISSFKNNKSKNL